MDDELDVMLRAVTDADSLTTAGEYRTEPLSDSARTTHRTLDVLTDHDVTDRRRTSPRRTRPRRTRRPRHPALLRQLRAAEDTGGPAEHAVAAITARDLIHARDPAAVLHARLSCALA
ncbi:MAG: hypothetical protein ACRDQ5_00695, partial [Sciscionella sp.]